MGGLTNTQGMGGQPGGVPPGERFSCRGQFGDFCFPALTHQSWLGQHHTHFSFSKKILSRCPFTEMRDLSAQQLSAMGWRLGPLPSLGLPGAQQSLSLSHPLGQNIFQTWAG